MAELSSRQRFPTCKAAGHWPQQERPEATSEVLLDFVTRVAPT